MDYKVTDTELTSVADAIRTKGSTSAPLEWPDGFAQAVTDLPSGGSDDNYLIAMGVKSGSIYDSVTTYIPTHQFNYHRNLLGINMLTVTSIGTNAFENCNEMSNISFPNCTLINYYAFEDCSKLLEASFPKCTEPKMGAFKRCVQLSSISFPLASIVEKSVFEGDENLLEANFPECLSIDATAFYGCKKLTRAIFPKCTQISGQSAFTTCWSLAEISFPVCTYIGFSAFVNCYSLSVADFPACTTIKSAAFLSCHNLSLLSFTALKRLEYRAFESVGWSASALSIYMPNLEYASTDCFIRTNVVDVELPKASQVLNGVFYQCSNLQRVSFPMCTSLGTNTFAGCSALTSIYLTNSVVTTYGGSRLFQSTPIENSTYTGTYGSIYVPESLVDAYKAASGWSSISDRITAYIE